MTVATFYPDADPESNSVDGDANCAELAGVDWADLLISTTTFATDDYQSAGIYIGAHATTNKWRYLYRGFISFPTISLESSSIISSARVCLYGEDKDDPGNFAPDINIYGAYPLSNTALVGTDFSRVYSIPFCDTPITYAKWKVGGWNEFILNAAGISAINKGGITKFSMRNACYDVAGVSPVWDALEDAYLNWVTADQVPPYVVAPPYLEITSAFPTVTKEILRFGSSAMTRRPTFWPTRVRLSYG